MIFFFRTVVQERQFETICKRLLNARTHFSNAVQSLMSLKNEKPKAYLVVMMGVFAILAWIGSLIDNLLLTYLLGESLITLPKFYGNVFAKKMFLCLSKMILT